MVIKAIEIAWICDWKHIWLKVDSSLVPIDSPHMVPWKLQVAWKNCIHRISMMHFRSSYIFREGNQVADALANFGSSSTKFTFGTHLQVSLTTFVLEINWVFLIFVLHDFSGLVIIGASAS